jgi:hypothetical protein
MALGFNMLAAVVSIGNASLSASDLWMGYRVARRLPAGWNILSGDDGFYGVPSVD